MNDTPPQIVKNPRSSGAWPLAFGLLPLVGLLVWGLMTPLPYHGRMFSSLGDLVHGPAFALVSLGCYLVARRLGISRCWGALGIWLAMCAFGLATEVAQSYVGRGDSWEDLLNDALGAAGGVCIGMALEAATRTGKRLGIALGLTMVLAAEVEALSSVWDCLEQQRAMPLLASFEGWREVGRWCANDAELRRVAAHATDGEHALRVDLFPGYYPGVVLVEPPRDWSAYKELVFDIDVEPEADGDPNSALLELIVKIQDRTHNGDYHDRFHRMLKLSAGKHEVRIPLSEVAAAPRDRSMDLTEIDVLQLFTMSLHRRRTFYLDHVRLE